MSLREGFGASEKKPRGAVCVILALVVFLACLMPSLGIPGSRQGSA